ncbi:hypothetical protein ACLKA6_012004 [Drosophila palustris]
MKGGTFKIWRKYPCCCRIKLHSPCSGLGHSPILAAAGSSLQSLRRQNFHQSLPLRDPVIQPLTWQDHQQPLLIRVGHQEVSAAGSVLRPDRETREAEGAEGKDL